MIDLTKVRNYYVACGYTDLRLGIDGLAAVVTQQYSSRRTDRIAQFASTDCPFRMSGAGSSVEAVWVSGRIFYLFSGFRSRIFLPFISRR